MRWAILKRRLITVPRTNNYYPCIRVCARYAVQGSQSHGLCEESITLGGGYEHKTNQDVIYRHMMTRYCILARSIVALSEIGGL
jgi:hypothetical protein